MAQLLFPPELCYNTCIFISFGGKIYEYTLCKSFQPTDFIG